MFLDDGICIFLADIDYFDGYFFFVGFVGAPEDVGSLGEVEVIVETVRIVLNFLPQFVPQLSMHIHTKYISHMNTIE